MRIEELIESLEHVAFDCNAANAEVIYKAIEALKAQQVGPGPDYSDGHDHEGFQGGCERMGCDGGCNQQTGGIV
jgi:hypothetical protein